MYKKRKDKLIICFIWLFILSICDGCSNTKIYSYEFSYWKTDFTEFLIKVSVDKIDKIILKDEKIFINNFIGQDKKNKELKNLFIEKLSKFLDLTKDKKEATVFMDVMIENIPMENFFKDEEKMKKHNLNDPIYVTLIMPFFDNINKYIKIDNKEAIMNFIYIVFYCKNSLDILYVNRIIGINIIIEEGIKKNIKL